MKRILFYILLGMGTFALAALFAQEPVKSASVPSISDAHRAEFFKRQLALQQAQQTMTVAQTAFQSAVQQLAKDCGEKFLPQIGPDGDPVCAVKTVPAKKESK